MTEENIKEIFHGLLFERWNDGFIDVFCKACNKVLVEIDEDTRKGWLISDCEHFRWELVNIRCIYDPDMCKDLTYSKELKLRIDNGDYFFLLVPRDEGEGE